MNRSRMILALAVGAAFLNASCGPERNARIGQPPQIAMSDAILNRLSEPYDPIPGCKFAGRGYGQNGEPVGFSGSSYSPSTAAGITRRTGHTRRQFVQDLSQIDLPKLRERLNQIEPSLFAYPGGDDSALRSWEDLVAAVPRDRQVLSRLARGAATFYADKLSGLGLFLGQTPGWHSEEGASVTVDVWEAGGGSQVHFTSWASVAPPRLYVEIYYFVNADDRDSSSYRGAQKWGTRRAD